MQNIYGTVLNCLAVTDVTLHSVYTIHDRLFSLSTAVPLNAFNAAVGFIISTSS